MLGPKDIFAEADQVSGTTLDTRIGVPTAHTTKQLTTMLVSLTVGKVDAGVTVLLTPDKRLVCEALRQVRGTHC